MTRLDIALGDVQRMAPTGESAVAISQTFKTINFRKTRPAIPKNKDDYGLTFFTRPQLNMSLENIRHDRYFNQLATFEPDSIQRIIRCTLDPRLHASGNETTRLIDHRSAFIPLLTNNLLTISGWPDSVVESFTSKPGVVNESFGFIDSVYQNFSPMDLSVSFRNMPGSPVSTLIDFWRFYGSNVAMGIMAPYIDIQIDYEIDYQTAIWRLVLDANKTYVQHLGRTIGYPTVNNNGKVFDYQADIALNMNNDELSFQFKCFGVEYNDPILIYEFNKVVGIFNPYMRDRYRRATMRKIPVGAADYFNNVVESYPRINPATYELEWWVTQENYATVLALHSRTLDILANGDVDYAAPDQNVFTPGE